MTINIVMLVKDRPALTQQAIDSLFQHTDRNLFNLTVVDDGSKARTKAVLDLLPYPSSLCVSIYPSKGIVGLVRNLGVLAAETYWGRGDLLYLSDNDVYFTSGWLDKMLAAWPIAKTSGYKILGGYNHPYQQVAGVENGNASPPVSYRYGEIREYYAVAGPSWLLEWETWDSFGKFEAKAVGVCKSEDWEYCQRVRSRCCKVGAVWPHVVYNTGLTNTVGEPTVGHEAMTRFAGVRAE